MKSENDLGKEVISPRSVVESEREHHRPYLLFFEISAVVLLALVGLVLLYFDVFGLRDTNSDTSNLSQSGNQIRSLNESRLIFYEGDVSIWQGGVVREIIDNGVIINEGDSVKTGMDGFAVIGFSDGSVVRLNQQSELKIVTVASDEYQTELIWGEAYSRVVKNPMRSYSMQAGDITATAMGTAFNVRYMDDYLKDIEVTTIDETVLIERKSGEDKIVLESGKRLVVNNSEPNLNENQAALTGDSFDNEWYFLNKNEDLLSSHKDGWLDDFELDLSLALPSDNFSTSEVSVRVQGSVNPLSTVKLRSNDGEWIKVDNIHGEFEALAYLKDGWNRIEFKAWSPRGESAMLIRNIEKTPSQNTIPSVSPVPPIITPLKDDFRIVSLRSENPGTLQLEWSDQARDDISGYMIVFGSSEGPVFGRDVSYYAAGKTKRDALINHDKLLNGGRFYVRVCRYIVTSGDKDTAPVKVCEPYTQSSVIDVAAVEWGAVTLDLKLDNQEDRFFEFSWEVGGNGSTAKGYKLVWSRSQNPTYPPQKSGQSAIEEDSLLVWLRSLFTDKVVYATESPLPPEMTNIKTWGSVYISDQEIRRLEITMDDEYESGTWYFRLCRYRGESCDLYSNELRVEF